MYVYQEAYMEQKERELKLLDVSAYYNGLYVQQAIASCFSKRTKYPEKPLLFGKQNNAGIETVEKELTEEQKVAYQKQLLMQLQVMQSNFETGKK